MKAALLDANVLIALIDPAHIFHRQARRRIATHITVGHLLFQWGIEFGEAAKAPHVSVGGYVLAVLDGSAVGGRAACRSLFDPLLRVNDVLDVIGCAKRRIHRSWGTGRSKSFRRLRVSASP